MTERFNAAELLAVIAARQLRDDTAVFAGVGVPLLAAALAKRRHAPRLTMVIEGGIIGPQIAPGETAAQRASFGEVVAHAPASRRSVGIRVLVSAAPSCKILFNKGYEG